MKRTFRKDDAEVISPAAVRFRVPFEIGVTGHAYGGEFAPLGEVRKTNPQFPPPGAGD
ncbi:MAG: hypothetical protein IPI67_30240 [Myxococcales bacterium]|nr:hypothetical protein [Myxococcales bacterium]